MTEGRILRAPVPAAMTPQIDIVTPPAEETLIYRVSTSGRKLRLRAGVETGYQVIGTYDNGTQVIALDTTNPNWYEVSCPDGKHGYMSASNLQYVRTTTSQEAKTEVIEARQLRDQPFRIYRIVPELDKVTVYARHIFYDLLDNMIRCYKPAPSDTGAAVVQGIASNCLSAHNFTSAACTPPTKRKNSRLT